MKHRQIDNFIRKYIKSSLPSPIASGMCPEKSKQFIYIKHILKTSFICILYVKYILIYMYQYILKKND